jgi:peptide/nickel transport system ATP-binding protein
LLLELSAEGKSLFVITHDLEVAQRLSGDMAVMYGGSIVETGSAGDIIDNPRHPYTQALLASLPQNGLNPIPLTLNDRKVNGGCNFSPRCTHALLQCFDTEPPYIGNDREKRFSRCHRYR